MNCFSSWCACLSSSDQFSGKQIGQDEKLSKVLDSAFSRENSSAREVKWEENEDDDDEPLVGGVEESKDCGEPLVEEDDVDSPVEVVDPPPPHQDYSPSGYPIKEKGEAEESDKEIIVHPRYPKGSAHFLHPNLHLRPSRSVQVPGIPFDFVVSQRQQDDGGDEDDTGFGVWRGSVALCAYLVKHADALSREKASIELGCGSGALASSVASWLGVRAHATDRPQLVESARNSCRNHREAAANAGAPMTGPPVELHELEWGPETAAAYVQQRGRFDLVLGSEVIYALAQTTEQDALQNFRKLISTIDTLLNDNGTALIAWCPRSRLEDNFFSTLSEFHLVYSGVKIDDLGLSQEQTDGLQLVSITREAEESRETIEDSEETAEESEETAEDSEDTAEESRETTDDSEETA